MSDHHVPVEVEPRTPVWLTVFGGLLLLAVAIWWLSPSRAPDATIRVPGPAAAGVEGEQGAAEPAPPTAPQPTTIRVPAIQERLAPGPAAGRPDKATPRLRPSLKVLTQGDAERP